METHKNMTNLEVAKLLRAVAAAYQVSGDKDPNLRFRIIAYERAADAIEHATSEVKDLWEEGKLDEIPGIGKAIAEHLDELFKTGKVKHFEEVTRDLPPAMFELLDVSGIGAKSAYKLTKELGITKAHGALEKLQKAAEKGHIRAIEGFAEGAEKEILASVKEVKERTKRLLLPYAASIGEDVLAWLKKYTAVKRAEPLGSLRRQVATVGDIDIAVATDHPKDVIEHFTNYPKKVKVIEKGEATSSVLLPGGVQVDLMTQPPNAFGALLQHLTGSKHHNVALRTFAIKKHLSLSEHGIKKRAEDGKWRMEVFETEEKFYKSLGMDWIPPELREDGGEIEASLAHKLPHLVELGDIKGDLHMHSNFPPETSHDVGQNSMEEMVAEAQLLGYEYIAFSEHNPKSSEAKNKISDILKEKKERVEKLNSTLLRRGVELKRVFNCLEIDIQPTGTLALPEEAFELIDFAIVSIHSSFRGTKEKQTKRILRALEHPKVKILGHPTARKLNEREGVDYNWPEIFEFCKVHDKWLEINSSPDRLDLPDVLVREAIKAGVKLIINTDSHAVDQMRGMRYGVSVARRGWAEKDDIVNTRSLSELDKVKILYP